MDGEKPESTASKRRLALAVLPELEKRARSLPNIEQLNFFIVNETINLYAYRQSVLFSQNGKVIALSGLAVPDPKSPYVAWCELVFKNLESYKELKTFLGNDMTAILGLEWAEWWPNWIVWIPLEGAGTLLLASETQPDSTTLKLLEYLSDAYAHALRSLQRKNGSRTVSFLAQRRFLSLVLMSMTFVAVSFIPVTDSALGQVQIVPRDPVLIRAPLDGVIERLSVQPNQIVSTGDVLFRMDDTRLRSRLQAALKDFDVADAELRLTSQQAVLDREAAARLQVMISRREQAEAEVIYLQDLMQRIVMSAPRDGFVVFDNVNDLIGRPVAIGEQIMQIAAPLDSEVEIRLPIKDAIKLPEQARVRVFLNVDPHRPRDAIVRYASYQAIPGEDGILAYRLLASPVENGLPMRIGQKGTARIEGYPTVVFMKLFRRPLTALRQTLGL